MGDGTLLVSSLFSFNHQSLKEFPPHPSSLQLSLDRRHRLQETLKHQHLVIRITSVSYSFDHLETFSQVQSHAHKDFYHF